MWIQNQSQVMMFYLRDFHASLLALQGVNKKNSLGKSHGFDCQIQGTLFFEIARILEHHRPKAFLLENVKISNSNSNLIDQINDLNKLKEQGIISDEEFKKAKEKILN